jgi:hypothetical protein
MLDGIEFFDAKPEIVIDYLKSLKIRQIEIDPAKLRVGLDGRSLKLMVQSNGKEYPVRRSFIHKLLRWYSFPLGQLSRLSGETITSVCNDFLLNIKKEYVTVRFEGDQVLTIKSPQYNQIDDLDVIKKVSRWGLGSISRNDFFMRITTKEKSKFEPVKGDYCGAGLAVMNSETGFHSLSVQFYILRYVCSNGAVVETNNTGEKKVHYGRTENLSDFLDNQITEAGTRKEEIISSFKKLRENRLTKRNNDLIKKFYSLTGERILQDGSVSYSNFFHHITEKAKEFGLSKRIYLEKLAGELLSDIN